MKITRHHKGILLMVAGLLVLLNTLHALGWGINIILIVAAIGAIAWGFVLADGYAFIMDVCNTLFKRKKK